MALAVKLIQPKVSIIPANDDLCDLPDLKQVVFGGAADQPWLVRVPAEVSQMVSMAAVHEEPAQTIWLALQYEIDFAGG